MKKPDENKGPSKKFQNKFLWSVLFVIFAAMTIWAVILQGRAFSVSSFLSYVLGASKVWLVVALIGVFGFLFFEGKAISAVCRAFGYSVGRKRGFTYAAADVYCSSITPSGSGGQPACAYFMIKDGIPGIVTTITLLINLTMYTLSILFFAVLTLLIRPDIFLSFDVVSRILIVSGYFLQGALAAFLLLLLLKGNLLHKICRITLHFFCKIRLLKREEEKQQKLASHMEEYAMYAQMIKEHKGAMAKALLWNLLQRASITSVTVFAFLATGGIPTKMVAVWATQCYALIGSNSIPIPGAMGVSDYILLEGFGNIMPDQNVVNFELFSRALSFYVCVILCGVVALVKYWLQRRRERAL